MGVPGQLMSQMALRAKAQILHPWIRKGVARQITSWGCLGSLFFGFLFWGFQADRGNQLSAQNGLARESLNLRSMDSGGYVDMSLYRKCVGSNGTQGGKFPNPWAGRRGRFLHYVYNVNWNSGYMVHFTL